MKCVPSFDRNTCAMTACGHLSRKIDKYLNVIRRECCTVSIIYFFFFFFVRR